MVLRRLLIAITFVLLAAAAAQETRPLLAGAEALQAEYPGNYGVSYTEARPFAQALGLAYWQSGDRLILGMGSLLVRLPVSAVPKSRTVFKKLVTGTPPHALRDGKRILVPVKYVARAFGCTYGGGSNGLRVLLPAASLQSLNNAVSNGRDVLVLRFDRNVNVVRQAPGHWTLLGVRAEEGMRTLTGLYLSDVRLAPGPLGSELFLDGASGFPEEVAYYPNEVRIYVGEKGAVPRPKPLVVIDPGHGGADAGAVYGNLKEKDIVLKVARQAAGILKRRGYRVRLTRDKDVQVSMTQRAQLAAQADVLISLHVAGSPLAPAGPGIFTYTGGTRTTPVFTARSRTLLAGGGYQPILRYYAQPPGGVARLAGLLESELGRIGLSARKGETPLYLLERAPGAAVLFELGSLSNGSDRARLSSSAQQSAYAQVIALAVASFLGGGS